MQGREDGEARAGAELLRAAALGQEGRVAGLLAAAGGPDARRDAGGRGALHLAAGRGHAGAARLLLSKGADADADDHLGRTPLHYAAEWGQEAAAALLVKRGAWVDALDGGDDTPLHLAARRGRRGAAEVLCRDGRARVAGANRAGLSPAGEAAVHGHLGLLKDLHGRGAELDDVPGSYSLLHVAAGLGRHAVVAFLLDLGHDPDGAANEEGLTALHCAALGADLTTVRTLLNAGASPTARNIAGKLPGEVLPDGAPEELAELLPAEAAREAAEAAEAPPPAASAAAAGGGARAGASREQRREGAQRLAETSPAELERQGLLDLLKEDVLKVQRIQQAIQLQYLLGALHANSDFQRSLAKAAVAKAVDAVVKDPLEARAYQDNPEVMDTLNTLRRMQDFCRRLGIANVARSDLLAKPGYEAADEKRKRQLQAVLDKALDAIAAKVEGRPGDGEAVEEISPPPETAREGARGAKGKAKEKVLLPPQGPEGGEGAPAAAAAGTKREFWVKVKKAFVQQMISGALALCTTMIFMKFFNFGAFFGTERAPAASGPGDSEFVR